jgi:DNA-binding NarL/FixJ family response regulator
MDQPIRVLVANRPRLIREMVLEAILGQPDMEVVAEIEDEKEIVRMVEATCPDFLIIALDSSGEHAALCQSLLPRFPKMKILALAPEQNISVFFWGSFDIHSKSVEASEDGILNALRLKGSTHELSRAASDR